MDLHAFIEELNKKRIDAYERMPGDIKEHHGIEQTVLAGGYGYRQILELVQNGADAILEGHEAGLEAPEGNRIHVLVRDAYLYVANTGAPLDDKGVEALLSSHQSPKRGNQIGRFGLGFKSLLRFGGTIDLFTKRSGAMRFDPKRCQQELKERFGVENAPGLRLAWPLDDSERHRDGNLEGLAWAETVVRAKLPAGDRREHLLEEIQGFPAEFLLFFPLPTELILDDGNASPRKLCVETKDGEKVLHDGEGSSRWRVTAQDVHIGDEAARSDATHIHERETVPLAWAMPLEGKREEAGRFWAFFPTQTQSRIPGILNAPWKLNSDRNAIIGGEWNAALMCEAAKLVASSLGSLASEDDPARALDAFPRQMERKDEDAAPLVEALWRELRNTEIIPDGTGRPRPARELKRHPRDHVDLARQWQKLASVEVLGGFVHASCLERQRASRLDELAKRLASEEQNALRGCLQRSGAADRFAAVESTEAKRAIQALKQRLASEEQNASEGCFQRSNAADWFAAVASTETERAVQVLELAETFKNDCNPSEWSCIHSKLAIIPTQGGKLVTANRAVFAPAEVKIPGREAVAASLSENSESRRLLANVMGVEELDDKVWQKILQESLPKARDEAQDDGRAAFWQILRASPESVRKQFVRQNRNQIRVRRRDGKWVNADMALLPGALIDEHDSSSNRNLLIDPEVHGHDEALLKELGVCEFPEGTVDLSKEDAGKEPLSPWVRHWRSCYKRTQNNSALRNFLMPLQAKMPRGWQFLPTLAGEANAKLTARYIDCMNESAFRSAIKFGHRTDKRRYPKIDVPHPLTWLLLTHGRVQVGKKFIRLSTIAARCQEPALRNISAWKTVQSVMERPENDAPVDTPGESELMAFWHALFEELITPGAIVDERLEPLWIGAARDGVVPMDLLSMSNVYVTSSPVLARHARESGTGKIAITLDEATLKLWLNHGARNLADIVQPQWSDLAGPADRLTSAVPELKEVLKPELRETSRCQPVSGLELKIDDQSTPTPCLMWDNALLLDMAQLCCLSRADWLHALLREVAAAGWLDCKLEEARQRLGDAHVDKLRKKVAGEPTLAARLLRAVGERREPLQEALGEIGDMVFVEQCTPLKLAELTLAQLGPATLASLKETLEEEGLKPPSQWGSAKARAFVTALRFPEEYAASPSARREPEEIVSGPIELPPLHDFQQEVFDGIKQLLESGAIRRRAVVSLPTGGGKTRVTVEAAVRLVLAPKSDHRSVLWIAQTDELCEQAVQAFRQVWVNRGAQGAGLRIARLWGGNPNPVPYEPGRPLAVVASIQTLNSRMESKELTWLKTPGLVVVDECHHAITRSYTNLLRWLDAMPRQSDTSEKDEPPILGLSATPFRMDDEESQRLAKRFDKLWFPQDQEGLYERLREASVLADVRYEPLKSVSTLPDDVQKRLDEAFDDVKEFDIEKLLQEINDLLAKDSPRNQWLLEFIEGCDERSILFFTNSVRHAEEMAARLNLAGIPAAAVSGDTSVVARRYFLDRFQRGEIRVLCNHSVLTTGFDAPKTDMVLIARQVFSPVRYMQMVGRGLRGEKNGGTARCRIVTVVDNLGRFRERHPYRYCQRYFQGCEEGR